MHAQPGSSVRILLVSEKAPVRDELCRVLDTAWPVGSESDPHKALRLARRVKPTAVVAEAELASRNDWRLLHALRRGATAGVPLLLIAPATDPALREACFAAGADDLMVEPVAPRELRHRIARQIEIAQLRADARYERARAREALSRMAEKNEAVNRAKDQFIAMLGHDLRHPLFTIGSALELMQLVNADSHEQAIIKRQVGHMMRLVDGLLDLSRISAGKLGLDKRRLDLSEVVNSAVDLVTPSLEQRAQVLEVDAPERVYVDGDAVRLRQVFVNLLDNSGKYSSRGSRIVIAVRRRSTSATVSVLDQGVGVDPIKLERIFELFVQENDAAVAAGAGLGIGLSIVRSIVRLHGGEVTAHSEGLGKGCEFVVTLPALPNG